LLCACIRYEKKKAHLWGEIGSVLGGKSGGSPSLLKGGTGFLFLGKKKGDVVLVVERKKKRKGILYRGGTLSFFGGRQLFWKGAPGEKKDGVFLSCCWGSGFSLFTKGQYVFDEGKKGILREGEAWCHLSQQQQRDISSYTRGRREKELKEGVKNPGVRHTQSYKATIIFHNWRNGQKE